MRVCSICKKPKEDVTEYHITSYEEFHTFWSLDMCISCRDQIFRFIKALKNSDNDTEIVLPHTITTNKGK